MQLLTHFLAEKLGVGQLRRPTIGVFIGAENGDTNRDRTAQGTTTHFVYADYERSASRKKLTLKLKGWERF